MAAAGSALRKNTGAVVVLEDGRGCLRGGRAHYVCLWMAMAVIAAARVQAVAVGGSFLLRDGGQGNALLGDAWDGELGLC
jgi:hypothetical protein